MRIVWVALIGLGVGLGAGTGVSAVRVRGELLAEKAQARADSLAARPAAGAEHGDDGGVTVLLPPEEEDLSEVDAAYGSDGGSGAPAPEAPEPHPAPPAQEHVATDPVADTAGSPGDSSVVGSAGGTQVPQPNPVNPEGAKKLAKIFGAMKPADAAAVLMEMTDEEVTVILLQMTDRQAGPIVSAFSADRAAGLSSSLLRARKGSA